MVLENYYLYRFAIWLVTHFPRGFVYAFAGFVAELNFFLNTRSRRGVFANLERVLPPHTSRFRRWWLARSIFRNFAFSLVDFLRLPTVTRETLDQFLAEIKGWEHVKACVQAGKGGILVGVHMGSWELGGAVISLLGIPLTVAALPHKDERVDAIFLRHREASGIEVAPVGSVTRRLITALKHGRFIALVSDRDVTGAGPVLPFFGQPTHVPNGHARLALSTGAWIIPATTYRMADRRIGLEFREPIIADPATDTAESLTQRCLAVLEDFIREHPDQWLSFFNLWSNTELPVA